jgi:hypothetical protein
LRLGVEDNWPAVAGVLVVGKMLGKILLIVVTE